MEAIDVADLVEATLEIFGATKVAISDIRPAPFGGRDGFRFEVEFVEEGLIYLAAALGSIDDQGRLDLIVYAGTLQHYFELIPTVIDQNPCAHLGMPRDMIFHGWSMRLFQAWQHSATMSS